MNLNMDTQVQDVIEFGKTLELVEHGKIVQVEQMQLLELKLYIEVTIGNHGDGGMVYGINLVLQ